MILEKDRWEVIIPLTILTRMGYSECYPINMLNVLLYEINIIKGVLNE